MMVGMAPLQDSPLAPGQDAEERMAGTFSDCRAIRESPNQLSTGFTILLERGWLRRQKSGIGWKILWNGQQEQQQVLERKPRERAAGRRLRLHFAVSHPEMVCHMTDHLVRSEVTPGRLGIGIQSPQAIENHLAIRFIGETLHFLLRIMRFPRRSDLKFQTGRGRPINVLHRRPGGAVRKRCARPEEPGR